MNFNIVVVEWFDVTDSYSLVREEGAQVGLTLYGLHTVICKQGWTSHGPINEMVTLDS